MLRGRSAGLYLSRLVLVALTGIAIYLVYRYYMYLGADGQSSLLFEGAKYLIQLILIVVFGSGLLQWYSRERDKAEAVNTFRKDILSGLTRAYNDTKKVRRILKASTMLKQRSVGEIYEIPDKIYEEQMQKLIDPQLEYEFYKNS